jgi:hypothetical protein
MRNMNETAPALPRTSDIARRAAEYPFWRTVGNITLTSVLSVFVTLGFLAGSTWYGAVFSVFWLASYVSWAYFAFIAGYRKGARVKTEK